MNRVIRIFAICGGCLFSLASQASSMLEIGSGLTALHQLQDEIARGELEGVSLQKVILERITSEFEKVDIQSVDEKEYQFRLVELALSGGDRIRLGKLLRQKAGHGEFENLNSGVDAYLAGDMAKAAQLLGQEDLSKLGLSRAGHFLELARGTALLETDIKKSREAYELAILQAPGTLVEEVALRRLLDISRKEKDGALFTRCAKIYFRRYVRSPFAGEFLNGFANGASIVSDPVSIQALSDLIILLPNQVRIALVPDLVRSLIIAGKIDAAKSYIEALTVADGGIDIPENTELQLLAMLVEPGKLSAGALSKRVLLDAGKPWSQEMPELQDIARHVIWNIFKPMIEPTDAKTEEEGSKSAQEFAEVETVVAKAQAVLSRLDETAKGTP